MLSGKFWIPSLAHHVSQDIPAFSSNVCIGGADVRSTLTVGTVQCWMHGTGYLMSEGVFIRKDRFYVSEEKWLLV